MSQFKEIASYFAIGSKQAGVIFTIVNVSPTNSSFLKVGRVRHGIRSSFQLNIRRNEVIRLVDAIDTMKNQERVTVVDGEGRSLMIMRQRFYGVDYMVFKQMSGKMRYPASISVPIDMIDEFTLQLCRVNKVFQARDMCSEEMVRDTIIEFVTLALVEEKYHEQSQVMDVDKKKDSLIPEMLHGKKVVRAFKDAFEQLSPCVFKKALNFVSMAFVAEEMFDTIPRPTEDARSMITIPHMFLFGEDVPDSNGGLTRVAIRHLVSKSQTDFDFGVFPERKN